MRRPVPRPDHSVVAVSGWGRSRRFHAPGFEGRNAAVPVVPGNGDLCCIWPRPIGGAGAHLERHRVALGGPLAGDSGARRPGRHVVSRDPDGSLLEFVSHVKEG